MTYSPKIRCGANTLTLSGITGPVFPAPSGLKTHTYPLSNPEYTTTGRIHGTTALTWKTAGILKAARDTIWDFWDGTLDRGYNNVTVIDHRLRMLFEASWNEWLEQWAKERGGIYSVSYGLESPVPWTVPVWGCWPMAAGVDPMINFNLSGKDLETDGGHIVAHSADSNVLRLNGYAVKLSSGGSVGLSNTTNLNFKSEDDLDSSFTLMCQCRIPQIVSARAFNAMFLGVSGINDDQVSIRLTQKSSVESYLSGKILIGGSAAYIGKSDATFPALVAGGWYDLALTYNSFTGITYIYWHKSGDSTAVFTNFLEDLTSEESGIISTSSAPILPAVNPKNVLWLLHEATSNALASDAYLQNAFVLDGFTTPLEFNTYRRLCYLWNMKTSGAHPE